MDLKIIRYKIVIINQGISFTNYFIDAAIKNLSWNVIILITPHGTMFEDEISLSFEDVILVDLKKFGVPQVSMKLEINKPLTSKIYEFALKEGISSILRTLF